MNCICNRLPPKVGVEKGPHTSKCTSSKGFVLCLTGTLMNLCLFLAWTHTVHIESLCVYPLTIDFMAVGFKWASCRCDSLDFRKEEAGGLLGAIVGDSEDSIVGSLIITLESGLSLFLFLPLSEVDDRSGVGWTVIYMRLTSFPARVPENSEVMEHFSPEI